MIFKCCYCCIDGYDFFFWGGRGARSCCFFAMEEKIQNHSYIIERGKIIEAIFFFFERLAEAEALSNFFTGGLANRQ